MERKDKREPDNENWRSMKSPNSIYSKRVENVIKTLEKLMPNVKRIKIDGSKIWYNENGMDVPFEYLSAGHKSIVSMIGDLLIRFFEAQQDAAEPSKLEGIVLIDEFETHLHPKWQREFVDTLYKNFPNVQFIVTTHSILPFLGAPEGSLFLKVTRTDKEGTKVNPVDLDIANLLPNAILTSPLFDIKKLVSVQNKNFADIRTEDMYQEIEKNRQLDEILKEFQKLDKTIFDKAKT